MKERANWALQVLNRVNVVVMSRSQGVMLLSKGRQEMMLCANLSSKGEQANWALLSNNKTVSHNCFSVSGVPGET